MSRSSRRRGTVAARGGRRLRRLRTPPSGKRVGGRQASSRPRRPRHCCGGSDPRCPSPPGARRTGVAGPGPGPRPRGVRAAWWPRPAPARCACSAEHATPTAPPSGPPPCTGPGPLPWARGERTGGSCEGVAAGWARASSHTGLLPGESRLCFRPAERCGTGRFRARRQSRHRADRETVRPYGVRSPPRRGPHLPCTARPGRGPGRPGRSAGGPRSGWGAAPRGGRVRGKRRRRRSGRRALRPLLVAR